MRQSFIALALCAGLVAGSAHAVGVGGTLYIKARDTVILDKPSLKGKTVEKLQTGAQVKWLGAAPSDKQFHQVETANGKKGYTLQQNLSPNKPQLEVATSDGKPIDAQAFASSGAATKALSEAALKYSGGKTNMAELAKGVMTAEGIASRVSPEEAQKYIAKQTGGAK